MLWWRGDVELFGESFKIVWEPGEWVGEIGGDQSIIIIIVKFKSEDELVKPEELGSDDVGLEIVDVVTSAVPSIFIVIFLVFFEGKDHGFVAIFEKGVFFFLWYRKKVTKLTITKEY